MGSLTLTNSRTWCIIPNHCSISCRLVRLECILVNQIHLHQVMTTELGQNQVQIRLVSPETTANSAVHLFIRLTGYPSCQSTLVLALFQAIALRFANTRTITSLAPLPHLSTKTTMIMNHLATMMNTNSALASMYIKRAVTDAMNGQNTSVRRFIMVQK